MENEILDDEQLEGVAGGTNSEINSDFEKLAKFGFITKKQAEDHDYGAMNSALKNIGISIETHGGIFKSNKYRLNGEKIDRDDAWSYIIAHAK